MKDTRWQRCYPTLTEAWLTVEQGVMRRAFPGFRLVWQDEQLRYSGRLNTNFETAFEVELRLPVRYPEQEPHLWVVAPRLSPDTPHRYVDGRICAHADPFIPWRTTAASMISVMAGWLFRLERWRLEGVGWDIPIEPPGRFLKVHPDGTLSLAGSRAHRLAARSQGE